MHLLILYIKLIIKSGSASILGNSTTNKKNDHIMIYDIAEKDKKKFEAYLKLFDKDELDARTSIIDTYSSLSIKEKKSVINRNAIKFFIRHNYEQVRHGKDLFAVLRSDTIFKKDDTKDTSASRKNDHLFNIDYLPNDNLGDNNTIIMQFIDNEQDVPDEIRSSIIHVPDDDSRIKHLNSTRLTSMSTIRGKLLKQKKGMSNIPKVVRDSIEKYNKTTDSGVSSRNNINISGNTTTTIVGGKSHEKRKKKNKKSKKKIKKITKKKRNSKKK
jgi:hypothetical protein